MKTTPTVAVLLLLFGAFLVSAAVEAPPTPPEETRVVLRISRDFLQELIGQEFDRDEPIDTTSSGTQVNGSAHVSGTVNVKLKPTETESDFNLLVDGQATTQMVATRRPVCVSLHGAAEFHACRQIVLDRDALSFTAGPVEITACYHSELDRIDSFRGGLTGALVRRLAKPIVVRSLPEGDRTARDQIRDEVAKNLQEETDKPLPALNQVAQLVRHGEQLLKDTDSPLTELEYYRAATSEALLLSVGHKGRRIPALSASEELKAPVELWIRADLVLEEKDAINFLLKGEKLRKAVESHWKAIKPLVERDLPRRAAKLADLFDGEENIKIRTRSDPSLNVPPTHRRWLIIMFGGEHLRRLKEQLSGLAPAAP
jgi:hypothetical protein